MTHYPVPIELTITVPVDCASPEEAATIARRVVAESFRCPTFGHHMARAVENGGGETRAYRHDLLPTPQPVA